MTISKPRSPTDVELTDRIMAHRDIRAMEIAYRRYDHVLNLVALRYLADQAMAEDIVHDSWLCLWSLKDAKSRPRNLIAWLISVVKNKCIDANRRQKTVAVNSHKLVDDSNVPSPEQDFIRYESISSVSSSIHRMNDRHQSVLRMFYFSELKCDQIAELLGCSIGTVKSRLHYGRSHLADIVQKALRP